MSEPLEVRMLGMQTYKQTWQAMSKFTDTRTSHTVDELWLVQHPKVFTQGQAGKAEHILNAKGIPIVQSDRGGQVTYHGPGQIVLYTLIDLRRLQLGVREMVTLLENTALDLLEAYGVKGYPKADAPGVYVTKEGVESKIAALGLRVRRGCCFHGMSVNIDMDLSPFSLINPCGYEGMQVTQLVDLLPYDRIEIKRVEQELIQLFAKKLKATKLSFLN